MAEGVNPVPELFFLRLNPDHKLPRPDGAFPMEEHHRRQDGHATEEAVKNNLSAAKGAFCWLVRIQRISRFGRKCSTGGGLPV